ncbi:MAG: SurA N-terminal domain-containing protein [Deltaproteobacteria bacterium]|nr:SurA N-terminal domain-containing protein [Deltaproteobacteria bacterium]
MKTIRQMILSFLLLYSPLLLGAEVVDRIVAIVGNEIITQSDVKKYTGRSSRTGKAGCFDSNRGANPDSPPNTPHRGNPTECGVTTKNPLDALIEEKLMKQEMERLAITATDQDINNAIRDVLTRNKASLENLKSELAKKGTSFDQYKKNLSEEIRHMKFMAQVIFPRIRIGDDEIAHITAGDNSEDARFKARLQLLDERAPEELTRYLNEVRAKAYIDIKKPQ